MNCRCLLTNWSARLTANGMTFPKRFGNVNVTPVLSLKLLQSYMYVLVYSPSSPPQQDFPVIFHGVLGKDEREANSPSFFNVSEIEVLVMYLNKLEQTQRKKGLPTLSAIDIGIIAPYRKQVRWSLCVIFKDCLWDISNIHL